eukprot:100237_1
MKTSEDVHVASLEKSLAKLEVSPSYSRELEAIENIQKWSLRQPEVIVDQGMKLLNNHSARLGDKKWDMYERVFLAALTCHDIKARDTCLVALRQRFPLSIRVYGLMGLLHEHNGQWERAEKNYKNLLNKDPTHQLAWKRRVAIQKARGDPVQAVRILSEYVQLFSGDSAAWAELAELYIQLRQFKHARFCYEELLLINPQNWQYHMMYAEILYTIGQNKSNYDLARSYYIQSLELNPKRNLRSLFGLILCLRNPNDASKDKWLTWAREQVALNYSEHAPNLLSLIEKAVK